MATMNASEKNRRRVVFIGMASLGICIVLFLVFSSLGGDEGNFISDLSPITNKGIEGDVASSEASEQYNSMTKKHDTDQADDAVESGNSYISIPIGTKKEKILSDKKENKPNELPSVVTDTSSMKKNEKPVQALPIKIFSKEEYEHMVQALQALNNSKKFEFSKGSILYVAKANKLEAFGEQDTLPLENQFNTTSETSYFKPGEMYYSIVDTAINSDIPSPVISTVVSGKYRNTKFLGSFSRFEKRLIVKFDRAVLSDGTEIEIEAYAVDPNTTEASVASKVNSHRFSRWGGLIAASFLEGFGEAKKYSGAEAVDNSFGENTGEVVYSEYSVSDQAWIAAGNVGEKASDIFAQQFNRPPTVELNTGSAIGILILKSDKR